MSDVYAELLVGCNRWGNGMKEVGQGWKCTGTNLSRKFLYVGDIYVGGDCLGVVSDLGGPFAAFFRGLDFFVGSLGGFDGCGCSRPDGA